MTFTHKLLAGFILATFAYLCMLAYYVRAHSTIRVHKEVQGLNQLYCIRAGDLILSPKFSDDQDYIKDCQVYIFEGCGRAETFCGEMAWNESN